MRKPKWLGDIQEPKPNEWIGGTCLLGLLRGTEFEEDQTEVASPVK